MVETNISLFSSYFAKKKERVFENTNNPNIQRFRDKEYYSKFALGVMGFTFVKDFEIFVCIFDICGSKFGPPDISSWENIQLFMENPNPTSQIPISSTQGPKIDPDNSKHKIKYCFFDLCLGDGSYKFKTCP